MRIPKGLERCDVCGELKGTFMYADENDPEPEPTEVTCVCDGVECRICGRRAAHRPMTNYYDEGEQVVIHVSSFAGMQPSCRACRAAAKRRRCRGRE